VTKHRTPWLLIEREAVRSTTNVWELYDTTTDWAQSKDLSKEMPDKLRELQRLWIIEATRNKVLPLDDRDVREDELRTPPAGRR
jgi:arylsulfatase A-like enzyme